MKKTKNLNFKTTKEEAEEFMKIAETVDIPFSQIARESIRDRVDELKRTHPRLTQEDSRTNTNA